MTVDDETMERADDRRADVHESWDDWLLYAVRTIPTMEKLRDGCSMCDEQLLQKGDPDRSNFFIRTIQVDTPTGEHFTRQVFCSAECVQDRIDKEDAYIPEEPDKVLVGGVDMPQAEFTDATFTMDGTAKQVGVPVPGAFAGTTDGGVEYEYVGEPVYVKNDGRWVHDGVIERLFHEDHRTTLGLGSDTATVMLNHPDPERREEYKEHHADGGEGGE